MFEEISVTDLNKILSEDSNCQFLDVREVEEFEEVHAKGAQNEPLSEFDASRLSFNQEKPVYVICRSGKRSQTGCKLLHAAGYKNLFNVTGGTMEWVANQLDVIKS